MFLRFRTNSLFVYEKKNAPRTEQQQKRNSTLYQYGLHQIGARYILLLLLQLNFCFISIRNYYPQMFFLVWFVQIFGNLFSEQMCLIVASIWRSHRQDPGSIPGTSTSVIIRTCCGCSSKSSRLFVLQRDCHFLFSLCVHQVCKTFVFLGVCAPNHINKLILLI